MLNKVSVSFINNNMLSLVKIIPYMIKLQLWRCGQSCSVGQGSGRNRRRSLYHYNIFPARVWTCYTGGGCHIIYARTDHLPVTERAILVLHPPEVKRQLCGWNFWIPTHTLFLHFLSAHGPHFLFLKFQTQ